MAINVNGLFTLIAAAALYWLGDWLVRHIPLLKQYCIPAPLVGGLLFAIVNTYLYTSGQSYFIFDGHIQTFFMIVFFTTVGFTVRIPLLRQGGKAVILVLVLATVLTLAQNVLGAGVLGVMGVDPRLGLAVGSISLVGGPGTAAAFGPVLEEAGAVGGSVVGISAATFGLIMGSVLGGPTANWLIKRNKIAGRCESVAQEIEVEQSGGKLDLKRMGVCLILTTFCFLSSYLLAEAFTMATGVTLPWFAAAMLLSALVRNTSAMEDDEFPDPEAEAIGNVSLCAFLSMAMMSLKIWELAELAGPLVVALAVQTVFLLWFSVYIVFPRIGGDYDAAAMTAGFIGFSMGATSNAMANMQAVTNKYGPSPTAFLVIPLVGGMAIDFVNIFVISTMLPMLGALV